MPRPFTGPKMFCAGPNVLSQSKDLIAFSASSKTFVPPQKPILLNANHLLVWHKMFVTGTNVNKFLVRHKKFGPAQNILGPLKGQGVSLYLQSLLTRENLEKDKNEIKQWILVTLSSYRFFLFSQNYSPFRMHTPFFRVFCTYKMHEKKYLFTCRKIHTVAHVPKWSTWHL